MGLQSSSQASRKQHGNLVGDHLVSTTFYHPQIDENECHNIIRKPHHLVKPRKSPDG
ncbi:hypothetical protein KIN20_004758 [Parelaphostrongylus tenuis]|uniref:Uncharacterized protein n=1 Tax=Parelaphostrongylus tenuis TaxID=148309 RepID=A0AAD5MRV3_PARTN|nr:hypothetical protein KIN20_004758 [Parelaphostrongylus tenuis]